jgi:hypothetical protein
VDSQYSASRAQHKRGHALPNTWREIGKIMKHYRANFDQHGTNIVVGIFDAENMNTAENIFRALAWPGARFMNAFEVDHAEVARVRSLAGRQTAEQLSLFN